MKHNLFTRNENRMPEIQNKTFKASKKISLRRIKVNLEFRNFTYLCSMSCNYEMLSKKNYTPKEHDCIACMHFPHCLVFLKCLRWFPQTHKNVSSKMQCNVENVELTMVHMHILKPTSKILPKYNAKQETHAKQEDVATRLFKLTDFRRLELLEMRLIWS